MQTNNTILSVSANVQLGVPGRQQSHPLTTVAPCVQKGLLHPILETICVRFVPPIHIFRNPVLVTTPTVALHVHKTQILPWAVNIQVHAHATLDTSQTTLVDARHVETQRQKLMEFVTPVL